MSGRERRQRERNRVGESRAVRSLNSLQPLVRATPTPLTSTFFRLAEGQSINILMGLNCRFYPSNDGGSAARSSEPLIAPLSFLSVSAFSPFCLFVQISRIRKNVKKKKKNRIYEAFSSTARTLKSRSIHPIFFGKNELPGKIRCSSNIGCIFNDHEPPCKNIPSINMLPCYYRFFAVPFFFFFFFFLFFGQIDVFP